MNKANYLGSVNRAGETGHYPISTETLDFIQEQINLLGAFGKLAGAGIMILVPPSTRSRGVAICEGEVIDVDQLQAPLQGDQKYTLKIQQSSQDITTREDSYKDARTLRKAVVTPDNNGSLRANARGELYGSTLNLREISLRLKELQGQFDIDDSVFDVPLFTPMDKVFSGALKPIAIINRPQSYYRTEKDEREKFPFITGDMSELEGSVLKSSLVRVPDEDVRPGLSQELTTRDGVVYKRFIGIVDRRPTRLIPYDKILMQDVPWHAQPNSVLGTLSRTSRGEWIRTGIFKYGDLRDNGTLIMLRDNRHPLLNPDKCCIQLSVSPETMVGNHVAHSFFTLSQEAGLSLAVSVPGGDAQRANVTVTAIALPAPELSIRS